MPLNLSYLDKRSQWANVVIVYMNIINEPQHVKTNKMTCVPSEDSVQPEHLLSLIRDFAVPKKKHWDLSYPFDAQRRL